MLQTEGSVCLLGWEFWGTLENFQTIISLKYIHLKKKIYVAFLSTCRPYLPLGRCLQGWPLSIICLHPTCIFSSHTRELHVLFRCIHTPALCSSYRPPALHFQLGMILTFDHDSPRPVECVLTLPGLRFVLALLHTLKEPVKGIEIYWKRRINKVLFKCLKGRNSVLFGIGWFYSFLLNNYKLLLHDCSKSSCEQLAALTRGIYKCIVSI